MGPTNQAMVKLFNADQKYRVAQARYDAASKDVRLQESRVKELQVKLDGTALQLKEQQVKAGNTELDIKARDAKIERLREQQQTAKNNKEYQTFLVSINTEKVDKSKVEDELLMMLVAVERLQAEQATMAAVVETESQKLTQMRVQITTKLVALKSEVDALKPDRDAAAAEVPAKMLEVFDKLCERFDGEAMAAIEKPDRRVEEYNCTACNMSMAADIYNRLHSRDDVVFCPSCRRFLFIPDDLPPEQAINQKKKSKKSDEAAADQLDTSAEESGQVAAEGK